MLALARATFMRFPVVWRAIGGRSRGYCQVRPPEGRYHGWLWEDVGLVRYSHPRVLHL